MSFLRPLTGHSHRRCVLVNHRTGVAVAHDVQTALDSRSRRKGLLGRNGLRHDEALILAPCCAIHTFGMRFAIDVAFVARDGRVVKIVEHLAAWRIAASLRALATVELPAGQARRADLHEGDRLVVYRVAGGRVAAQPR
jgi:uncharacterized membrane protein (UPF0127 family)